MNQLSWLNGEVSASHMNHVLIIYENDAALWCDRNWTRIGLEMRQFSVWTDKNQSVHAINWMCMDTMTLNYMFETAINLIRHAVIVVVVVSAIKPVQTSNHLSNALLAAVVEWSLLQFHKSAKWSITITRHLYINEILIHPFFPEIYHIWVNEITNAFAEWCLLGSL